MDILVLDPNFNSVSIIDNYVSNIWTERYSRCGDFEIYTIADLSLLDLIRKEYYLVTNDSETVMIVESINLDTDIESGRFLTIVGRSLESILDRRIIWGQKVVKGNLQDEVRTLLNECIISPSDPNRKIPNFIFEASTDEAVTSLTIEAQFNGNNLYEVICSICEAYGLGFKITLNESNQFVFKLYAGKNRTYSQNENPYVIFSPDFDNIVSSNYLESNANVKNVALVAGEGEGSDRRMRSVGSSSGLARREMFVDALGISSKTQDGTLSDMEYNALLDQEGTTKLAECVEVSAFEASVDATRTFKYGEHFFMGDIVQTVNEYGIAGSARITELIRSYSESGLEIHPTFIMIEKEG